MSAAQVIFARAVLAGYAEAETAYHAALAACTAGLSPDRETAARQLDEAAADLMSWQQGLRQAQIMAGA